MILVFLGPPGSGKGTQAKALSQEKGWPQLSTGDMLRTAIASDSPLGREAKAVIDKGQLVADSTVVGLVRERISKADCDRGFILDGFPRTLAQAEALDGMLKGLGKSVRMALLFEIADAELVSRLSGRRTCLKCGAMYHVMSMQPVKEGICNTCGNALVQRDDDREEVIKKRLEVYHTQTEPLIQYFKKQNKIKTLDAKRSPKEVGEALVQALAQRS